MIPSVGLVGGGKYAQGTGITWTPRATTGPWSNGPEHSSFSGWMTGQEGGAAMLTPSKYYSSDERFEVQGTKGFARVNRCTARVRQEPSVEVYVDGESRTYHALDDDWGSSFRDSSRQYIRWLRGDPAGELLWSAVEARAVMQFLTAARESSRRNTPVRIEEIGP